MSGDPRPIGIFDSGVGGLTVLCAVRQALPCEPLLYLGDTARLPYGTKSPRTVRRYAIQAARLLVDRGIKLLVVACNTASSLALAALAREFADIPVIGVVEPGARAAARASHSGRIVVISTESTARYGAYEREILRLRPEARVVTRPCPLFVALAEEGWTRGEIVTAVAREYLEPLFRSGNGPGSDCLLLGCTHFPPFTDTLIETVGPGVTVVDSAATTAATVREEVAARGLAGGGGEAGDGAFVRMFATDAPERFVRVARHFLPEELMPERVELVDL